ncbi:MAG: VOC family protein [Nannocystaceae bacterium]|nr:VOC family protein [Nannocystaceae bacterium]
MLNILKIDHVGIRVRDRNRAVAFYELLGFEIQAEGVFAKGHPVIMQHASGVVINVLGPASEPDGPNVLMDVEAKHAGYTHIALRVESLDDTRAFLSKHAIAITGTMNFGDLNAVFIRDPDRNVIEFDEYPNDQPGTRADGSFAEHP